MSERQDPPRILVARDADFDALREGLRSARAAGPSEQQTAMMRAALGLPATPTPARGPGGEGGDGTTSGLAGAKNVGALSAAAKVGAGIAVVAGLFWGGSLLMERGPSVREETQHEHEVPSVAAGGAHGPVVQLPEPPAQHATSALGAPDEALEGVVADGVEGAAASTDKRAARSIRRRAPAVASTGDATAELALLQRARAHVRSAPERALALVATHEQRYGNGRFAEEREVIATEALLHAGREQAAKKRAARFRKRYPRSAHLRRLEALF